MTSPQVYMYHIYIYIYIYIYILVLICDPTILKKLGQKINNRKYSFMFCPPLKRGTQFLGIHLVTLKYQHFPHDKKAYARDNEIEEKVIVNKSEEKVVRVRRD